MTHLEIQETVDRCQFQDYRFYLSKVQIDGKTEYVLHAEYDEPDTVTGEMARQKTREWLLNPWVSKSQVVSTCFKCALTSMEHRTREWFTYKNKAIYQPHYDVEQLAAICEERTT